MTFLLDPDVYVSRLSVRYDSAPSDRVTRLSERWTEGAKPKPGKAIVYGLRDCCSPTKGTYGAHEPWCRWA